MAADGGCERDVVHRMNEGYGAWGDLKSVLSNRGLGIKGKKCLQDKGQEVAAQAVRWPGVPKVARSHLSQCSKSCDLQPALNCAIRDLRGYCPV